jgi:hypothetical protein
MNDRFSKTPEPPYYAVIFSNQLNTDHPGYDAMGERMFELALRQPACCGAESTRDVDGVGITVSYWKDEAAIAS